ncbi:MAG TPA: hypothetical protein VGE74_16455 [Gemmata sp.]
MDPHVVAAVFRYAARYGGEADFYGPRGEAPVAAFSIVIRLARGSDRLPEAVTALAAELGRVPTAGDVLEVLNAVVPVPPEVASLIRTTLSE